MEDEELDGKVDPLHPRVDILTPCRYVHSRYLGYLLSPIRTLYGYIGQASHMLHATTSYYLSPRK